MSREQQPSVGIVIPCYNEQEVIPMLLEELGKFMSSVPSDVSVLFVDDGSSDATFELLSQACKDDAAFACLQFSRNFGHQTAVTAGLRHAQGDVVAVMDADLQDPPAVIPAMIEKWREGFDVVYGIRKDRKEGALLRLAYSAFYRTLKKIAHIDIPLDAGDFCIMDRRVVDLLNKMPEHNRFVRGLRGWVGFRQIGIPYERGARAAGTPKYTLRKLFQLALDGLITFSSLPLRLASWVGAISAMFSLAFLIYILIGRYFREQTPVGWASTLAIVVFFGGIQLLVLGIMGEYIGRMFDEVKDRPHFVVSQTAGWLSSPDDLGK